MARSVQIICTYCGRAALKEAGAVNRARAQGANLYCGRECGGLGRRRARTAAEKKEEKRLYDMAYRRKNRLKLKVEKADYHKRSYDPATEAVKRKAKIPRHVEYCRRPEYKAWKSEYDQQYRAKKYFGEFWEAAILLNQIQDEVLTRISRYEIDLQNGKLGKQQQRRRDYERLVSNHT